MATRKPVASRPDLAAMLAPLARSLMALETPVLGRHGLTMWGYAVLSGLRGQEVRTQSALAESIGADKTRVIAVLDDLQDDGLINRQPDPADRRARLLSLTDRGARVHAAAQADIQRRENALLARLGRAERAAFLSALETLASVPRDEIVALAEHGS